MDSNWINEDAQCIHYGSEKFDFGISNCTHSHKHSGLMSAMEGVSGASKLVSGVSEARKSISK